MGGEKNLQFICVLFRNCIVELNVNKPRYWLQSRTMFGVCSCILNYEVLILSPCQRNTWWRGACAVACSIWQRRLTLLLEDGKRSSFRSLVFVQNVRQWARSRYSAAPRECLFCQCHGCGAPMVRWLMNVAKLAGWEMAREAEILGVDLPPYHFVHHKSHVTWRKVECGR